MRVLLVNDYGTLAGGAEVQLRVLRDGLRRRGHDARVLTTSARPQDGPSIADWECLGTTSRARTALQTANPWAAVSLRRVLRSFRPHVVHVKLFLTQLSPLILPLLREVPSIYHVVWYRPVCPVGTKLLPGGGRCTASAGAVCLREGCLPVRDWLPLMAQMRLWRRWSECFDVVVANSEATRRELERAGIRSVEVVHNGVAARPPRPPLADPPTIAFAGRLVREKGAAVLLRAFPAVLRRRPDAVLLVAGGGPELGPLRALAHELGVAAHVSFLGSLPPEELERRLAPAWVQVVPSLWDEPFGVVAAEASMRGTAVVASRAGGLAEIVADGETGALVPPGDAAALGEALGALVAGPERAEALGARAREVALARFGEDRYVERFLALYGRVAGRTAA